MPFLPGLLENILVFGGVTFLMSVFLMIAASLISPPSRPEESEDLHWSFGMLRLPEPETIGRSAWYMNIGLWWFLLGVVYCVIYLTFW